jgi:hypothetical protein
MKFIKAEMKLRQQSRHAKNRQTKGKPDDIYQGVALVSDNVSICGFEVVYEHNVWFRVQSSGFPPSPQGLRRGTQDLSPKI